MKAITVRQPWAHAIVHLGKTVENRTWKSSYRGPLLIHAASTMTREEYRRFAEFMEEERIGRVPNRHELQLGGIIGMAEMVACVSASTSRWFFGPNAFVLRNAKPVPFIPMPGRLNLFDVDPAMLKKVAA